MRAAERMKRIRLSSFSFPSPFAAGREQSRPSPPRWLICENMWLYGFSPSSPASCGATPPDGFLSSSPFPPFPFFLTRQEWTSFCCMREIKPFPTSLLRLQCVLKGILLPPPPFPFFSVKDTCFNSPLDNKKCDCFFHPPPGKWRGEVHCLTFSMFNTICRPLFGRKNGRLLPPTSPISEGPPRIFLLFSP